MSKRPEPAKKSPDIAEKPSGPPFKIRMGIPHMDALWKDLTDRAQKDRLSSSEQKLHKKWGKALRLMVPQDK